MMSRATVPFVVEDVRVDCEYYRQHYVDEHVDSKGNRTEDYFERYGLIIPFPRYPGYRLVVDTDCALERAGSRIGSGSTRRSRSPVPLRSMMRGF